MPSSIMLIDDDIATLKLVDIILTSAQLASQCIAYTNAEEGLKSLETRLVELILLDISMPGLGGFAMLQRIKENPKTSEIPVILLTAKPPADYLEKALDLGAVDYIQKPIIPSSFIGRVRIHLQNQHLQCALRNKNAALEHTNQLKNDLLSICSHDLRSPLAAIDMLCQLLRTKLAPQQSQEDAMRLLLRIQRQSWVAKRLVEALLDLNRIEDGQFVWKPSLFRPISLLEECLRDEEVFIENKGLQCEMTARLTKHLLFGDRELIGEALRNILGNAVRHAKSKINLTTQFKSQTIERGGDFLFSIENDGTPLAASLSKRIFEKHLTTEAKEGGYGLGLYIAKRVVEMHQGSIVVETGAWGVRFSLIFPSAFAPNQLPDLSLLIPSSIWIVSASKASAELFEGVLSEMGLIHVEIVLEPLAERTKALKPPHCVVLDLNAVPPAWHQHLQHTKYLQCALLAYGQQADWKTLEIASPQKLFQKVQFMEEPFNPLLLSNALLELCSPP